MRTDGWTDWQSWFWRSGWNSSNGRENGKLCFWVFFYRVIGIWKGVISTICTILKLKKTFFENWTSIKIKISSACVYEEYEVKIKMVQEQWLQLKMKFYSVITWKLLFNGGINLWWPIHLVGRVYCGGRGGFYQVGENWQISGWWWVSASIPPIRERSSVQSPWDSV